MRILTLIIIFTIAGCATKQYPIAVPLSGAENNKTSCAGLKLKLLEVEQIEQQINQIGKVDVKTVFGALGDFGIGNSMAKADARSALNDRKQSIRDAQSRKNC